MPELSTDFLRRVAAALPDGDLKTEIAARLPYRPERLFGAKATHPDYGDVLVISAHADKDGAVHVVVIDPQDREDGSDWFQLFLNELTFTPPTVAPKVLRTVEELDAAPWQTIVKDGASFFFYKTRGDVWLDFLGNEYQSCDILPNSGLEVIHWPGAEPAPAKPRVVETLEELKATALGTVVEGRGIGVAKLTGCNHWQSTNLDRGIGHSSMSAYMPLTVIKEGSDA